MSVSDQRLSKTALFGFLTSAATYPLYSFAHRIEFLGILFLVSLAAGLVLSILGVMRVRRSDGDVWGMWFALLGLFLLIPWAMLFQRVF